MTTRDLIQCIRDHAEPNQNQEFNDLLHKVAQDIEEFMGGPEEPTENDES